MKIHRSEPLTRFVATVRQSAEQGAADLPRYVYDQHYDLAVHIGLPEMYQPTAWLEDHRLIRTAAMLAGAVGGGLAGLVTAAFARS